MSINFDRAAEYYDATRGYPPEIAAAIGAALVAAAGATATSRFLEIGVGTGRIALPVIALGYHYTGVDISAQMMDRLRQKVEDLERETGKTPQAVLLQADMQALPFAAHSFDAVIAAHVFHLVADPVKALQEALRVLTPPGPLLICGDATTGQEPISVNETWRTIVREVYGPIPNSSESIDYILKDILAHDPAVQVLESRPVRWDYATTVAAELDGVRKRLWSNTWVLPDAVFEQCLDRLTTWCTNTYGSQMDHPLPRTGEFVIRKVWRST